MTFEQIEIAAKCVHKHKVDMINMVLEPIAGAFGVKKSTSKSARNSVSSSQVKKAKTKQEVEAKENHRLAQLKLLGVGVRDI